jgi:hypothetical protein
VKNSGVGHEPMTSCFAAEGLHHRERKIERRQCNGANVF